MGMRTRDFSASFKPLPHLGTSVAAEEDALPIFSYEDPARMFWNAMMNGLMDSGFTEQQAKDFIASKRARCMLDGDVGQRLAALGYEAGVGVAVGKFAY